MTLIEYVDHFNEALTEGEDIDRFVESRHLDSDVLQKGTVHNLIRTALTHGRFDAAFRIMDRTTGSRLSDILRILRRLSLQDDVIADTLNSDALRSYVTGTGTLETSYAKLTDSLNDQAWEALNKAIAEIAGSETLNDLQRNEVFEGLLMKTARFNKTRSLRNILDRIDPDINQETINRAFISTSTDVASMLFEHGCPMPDDDALESAADNSNHANREHFAKLAKQFDVDLPFGFLEDAARFGRPVEIEFLLDQYSQDELLKALRKAAAQEPTSQDNDYPATIRLLFDRLDELGAIDEAREQFLDGFFDRRTTDNAFGSPDYMRILDDYNIDPSNHELEPGEGTIDEALRSVIVKGGSPQVLDWMLDRGVIDHGWLCGEWSHEDGAERSIFYQFIQTGVDHLFKYCLKYDYEPSDWDGLIQTQLNQLTNFGVKGVSDRFRSLLSTCKEHNASPDGAFLYRHIGSIVRNVPERNAEYLTNVLDIIQQYAPPNRERIESLYHELVIEPVHQSSTPKDDETIEAARFLINRNIQPTAEQLERIQDVRPDVGEAIKESLPDRARKSYDVSTDS